MESAYKDSGIFLRRGSGVRTVSRNHHTATHTYNNINSFSSRGFIPVLSMIFWLCSSGNRQPSSIFDMSSQEACDLVSFSLTDDQQERTFTELVKLHPSVLSTHLCLKTPRTTLWSSPPSTQLPNNRQDVHTSFDDLISHLYSRLCITALLYDEAR
jgi:hypothetical protein